MKIRHLPGQEQRIETGPVQFGSKWFEIIEKTAGPDFIVQAVASHPNAFYVVLKDHGAVTVDVKERIFRLGYTPSRTWGDMDRIRYTGRNWLTRLVLDACAELKRICQS